jgi:hypothetical protein
LAAGRGRDIGLSERARDPSAPRAAPQQSHDQVAIFSALPPEFSRVRVPAHRYAVFFHRDHIATIRRTVNTI